MSRDIIVFGEDWGGLPSSTQHLVRRLASDRRILWVNSIGLRQPRASPRDLRRVASKVASAAGLGQAPGCEGTQRPEPAPFPVVQPLVWPMAEAAALRALNRALIAGRIRPAAERAGLRDPVLWASLPSAVAAVGALGESAVVYYCGDDFGALDGVDHAPALRMESEIAGRADMILAASPALAARFPPEKTRLLPHGADVGLFGTPAGRPADLPADAPVAGFYGSIAPWLDLRLVAGTARLLPDWQFLMLGTPSQGTDLSPLEGVGNVRLLGPRPHGDLPGYAQHWTAGIIPFLDTPQIRACNPLKLREYLAAGRPVVSTPFPALEPYRTGVNVAHGPEGFATALRAAREHGDAGAALRRSLVEAETWEARAADAAAIIESLPRSHRY